MLKKSQESLRSFANDKTAITHKNYFKESNHITFLGIPAASMRKIAKEFVDLTFEDILTLMRSSIHDERVLANTVLVFKYKKAEKEQKKIVEFYLKNLKYIQDWANVDNSAPYILGHYLLNRDKKILYTLVQSPCLWDRRVAIVASWWFIRNGEVQETLKLADLLLNDKEDLIHKAVGWMLREVGKRDSKALEKFLDEHAKTMPRTMLRYSIERFPLDKRQHYLKLKHMKS